MLRALEIERQPLLYSTHTRTLGQVKEQCQVKYDGGRQDRVFAEEIDLDLHGISKPSEDIDIVPALLVITMGRIIVDPDLVIQFSIQFRIDIRLQDVFEYTQFGNFLGPEIIGMIEYIAITIAENIGREPA